MKLLKWAWPLLIALADHSAQATSLSDLLNFNGLTVFANTTIGGGANTATSGSRSSVYGSVLSGDVATFGAGASVTGNFESLGAANISADVVGGEQNISIGGNVTAGGVTTLGAGGIIKGNIWSGDTATTGDHSQVGGNISSAGVLTVGANASVGGYLASGGTAVVSASGKVSGTVSAFGAITIGTPNTTGTVSTLATSPIDTTSLVKRIQSDVSNVAAQVLAAQTALSKLGTGTQFVPVTGSMTLDSGVYSAASWSPTAGSVYTLDAHGLNNQTWVFNMTDILVFGAGTKIVMANAGLNNTVLWNVSNGYAAVGANAIVIGTILAKTYISVGANAIVSGVNDTCGGVYSQTSYVSTGDGASIGGSGCVADIAPPSYTISNVPQQQLSLSAVPEPATYAMILAGLGLLGFSVKRKKQS